jgi:hypothetical protein
MTHDNKMRKQTKDLTLILLYLNSFNDNGCCRSWKGYDFDDLNNLADDGYISEGRKAKSVILYDKGIERAKMLCTKYRINFSESETAGAVALS